MAGQCPSCRRHDHHHSWFVIWNHGWSKEILAHWAADPWRGQLYQRVVLEEMLKALWEHHCHRLMIIISKAVNVRHNQAINHNVRHNKDSKDDLGGWMATLSHWHGRELWQQCCYPGLGQAAVSTRIQVRRKWGQIPSWQTRQCLERKIERSPSNIWEGRDRGENLNSML
jgi:hypothetical protein